MCMWMENVCLAVSACLHVLMPICLHVHLEAVQYIHMYDYEYVLW